jgi:hypothetical protein
VHFTFSAKVYQVNITALPPYRLPNITQTQHGNTVLLLCKAHLQCTIHQPEHVFSQQLPLKGKTISKTFGMSVRRGPSSPSHSVLPTSSGKGLHLYVYIPASNGYSLKCVPDDIPLKDIVSKYKFLLPQGGDVSRFHVFHNGLRLMDEERPLNSYKQVQTMVRLVLYILTL